MYGVTVFLILGIVGLAVLALALVFGDALDGLVGDLDLGDGLFSLPAMAGAVAAFGFAAAAVSALGAPSAVSLVSGAVAGAGVAWMTGRLTRAVLRMPTDPTLRQGDLVGRPARVVNDIRPGQLGEVLVRHAGQSLKMSARAARDLPVGSEVVVIEAESPTTVVVEAAEDFWRSPS